MSYYFFKKANKIALLIAVVGIAILMNISNAVCGLGTIGDEFIVDFTRTKTGGGPNGYYTVIQTDNSTTCTGPGNETCPKKESWQKLTDASTLDGFPIKIESEEEIEEIVYDDMRKLEVPDRKWEDIPDQFLVINENVDKSKLLEIMQEMFESDNFQRILTLRKSLGESNPMILDSLSFEDWELIRKSDELTKMYNEDIMSIVEDVPIKWEYEGVVVSSYYYAPTKEFVIKLIEWEAITLKDYKWTFNVVVLTEKEYVDYLLKFKK